VLQGSVVAGEVGAPPDAMGVLASPSSGSGVVQTTFLAKIPVGLMQSRVEVDTFGTTSHIFSLHHLCITNEWSNTAAF